MKKYKCIHFTFLLFIRVKRHHWYKKHPLCMGKITNVNVTKLYAANRDTEQQKHWGTASPRLRVHRKIKQVVLYNSFLNTVSISWGILKMTSHLGQHSVHQHFTAWLNHAKGVKRFELIKVKRKIYADWIPEILEGLEV